MVFGDLGTSEPGGRQSCFCLAGVLLWMVSAAVFYSLSVSVPPSLPPSPSLPPPLPPSLSLSLCYFLVYPCPEGREESRDFEAKAGLSGAEEVVRYLAAPWLPSPFFPDLEVEW